MSNIDKTNDPDYLPDNLPECHKLIKDLRSEVKRLSEIAATVAELKEKVANLEKQLSRKNRALYGKKSAKVNATLLTGTGKAVHNQTNEELENEKTRLNIVPEQKKGGGRSEVPQSVPARTIEHHLDADKIPCPCCGQSRQIIGFDVAHQLEFVKSVFEQLHHITFKYSCKNCAGQVVSATKPYQPIDKGLPGPGLLAKIATDKFWLHLPLYRQEQVFQALSLPINRSSMCRWLKSIAELLAPIVKKMSELILKSKIVQSDATTLPVIKRGKGKTHRSFIWVYRGDASYPYVIYDFSETEHSSYPSTFLKGFKGILQTDGTNKYNEIIKAGATAANCWAHVHCDFEDAWKSDSVKAEYPMGLIKSLFDIERVSCDLPAQGRYHLRQTIAKPKLADFEKWLLDTKRTEPPKTRLGEAVSYTLNHWAGLQVFLDNPNLEISNNASERSVKPFVLSRKNWLFAGSEEGGKTAATIMSLIETCKRLNINPFEYLKDVLTRFPSVKTSQIEEFLPDRWLALKQSQ